MLRDSNSIEGLARARSLGILLLALSLSIWGCVAPQRTQLRTPPQASPENEKRLHAAADAFYLAATSQDLKRALDAARSAGPDSAVFHELAAHFARLTMDRDEHFDHLYQALSNLSSDNSDLQLIQLDALSWTIPERDAALALFRSLSEEHPSPGVRARAEQLHRITEHSASTSPVNAKSSGVDQGLPMAVIGAWDNDQGKAFDTPLPPEQHIDLEGRYEGSLLEIGWRRTPAGPGSDGEFNFDSLFSPSRWAVAYAMSSIAAQTAGEYELRLSSSVPTKVWVDQQLLYEQRRIERSLFDQLVIPVRLSVGTHRILIKSAQNSGSWSLSARLTRAGGLAATGVVPAPQSSPPTSDGASPPLSTTTSAQMLDARIASLRSGPIRKAILRWTWATELGFSGMAVELGDAFVSQHPKSLFGRYALALNLWDDSQRDRTSDLLSELDKAEGEALPLLRLEKASILGQEGLNRRARELLVQVRDAHPGLAEPWRRLARLFRRERWLEDRCAAWSETNRLRPQWPLAIRELGDCLSSQGFNEQAATQYQAVLDDLPHDSTAVSRLISRATRLENWSEAETLARSLTRFAPEQPWTWKRLSSVYRSQNKYQEANSALNQTLQINPDDASAYKRLGKYAYEAGRKPAALDLWRLSLDRNPDDEKLSNRLRYLSPNTREAWEQDVPSEEQLDAAIQLAASTQAAPGANLIEALDHEVSRFNPDGTSINVVTQVLRAVNDSGRDQLLKLNMRYGGRLRVLNAYSVSPAGRRSQVSSTRGRTARFRGLEVGSTVVLQYRHDASAAGYLSRHVARGRTFQGAGLQTLASEWNVWATTNTQFHEWLQGKIQRTEEKRGELTRISWRAENLAPIVPEPYMPRSNETNARMLLSTVPNWDTFLEWEKALLVDAFRDNAEVRALASDLLDPVEGIQSKIERIHRYLMEEIRYQQDYETHIAGVKPHPASVVTRRGYGDCKDKAVLFISLARLVGIEVHFAILRTRPKGPLRRSVPMQQFDHAIVYVPPQQGVAEGRFYDPTADALDIDVLRSDDPGALALVLNTKTNEHSWIPIPYQAPSAHQTQLRTQLQLSPDGSATGTLHVEMQGSPASSIRRLARNPKRLTQAMQRFVGGRYSGATVDGHTVEEVTSLNKAAEVSLKVSLPTYGRLEGNQLRIQLPPIWSSRSLFQLVDRRYPLVLGAPRSSTSSSQIQLPKGARVVRLPTSQRIEAPCFSVTREVKKTGTRLRVDQSFESTCERIEPEDYALHRRHAEEISRRFLEEIVLTVPASARGAQSRATQSSAG